MDEQFLPKGTPPPAVVEQTTRWQMRGRKRSPDDGKKVQIYSAVEGSTPSGSKGFVLPSSEHCIPYPDESH